MGHDSGEGLLPLEKAEIKDNVWEATKYFPEGVKGPCRETALTLLRRLMEQKEKDLKGYRLLLPIVERAEAGSPLETLLWEMLCRMP